MVDLRVLKAHGVDSESWKKTFSDTKTLPAKTEAWLKRLRSRISDGRDRNFRHYKLYYAIDQAVDAPFRQTTATLAQAIANKNPNKEDALKAAMEWGLTHLIRDSLDPKTGKKLNKKEFSLPVFFGIILPIALGQLRIRVAKMVNDRNLSPYLKYEPLKNTPEQRAKCEIITDVIEAQGRRYGYPHIGGQAILKMCMYGDAFKFIHGGWDEEWQIKLDKDGKEKKSLVREGLRYHIPHPTRTYYDSAHAPATLNTDTGCMWAGYWRIVRYGDLRAQSDKLWNTDKLKFPAGDFRGENLSFFNTVYNSCALAFPTSDRASGDLDRERQLELGYYTSDFDDSAVTQSEHFEKIVPKDCGLGDYEYPIWSRWMIANDSDILFGEPLPGVPVDYWGYDPDDGREINPSLVLEVLPTQDTISNLMTQAILTTKQNLASLTFVNEDIVNESTLSAIQNLGEPQYRGFNLVRFSGMEMRLDQQDVSKAFGSVKFPQQSVSEIFGIIDVLMTTLARTTGISSQEASGQASHEQSAEEVRIIQASVTARVRHTGLQVDKAFDAWKRQLYTYEMAFGDEEIYAQLPADTKITKESLGKLGFTTEDGELGRHDGNVSVRGKKSALQMEYFASTREGEDRINNVQLAQAMLQNFAAVLGNQMMAQSIGPEQAVALFNQVLTMMGFPRDFRLHAVPAEKTQDAQAQQGIMQAVQKDMLGLVEQLKQFITQSDQEIVKQLAQTSEAAGEALKLGQDNMRAVQQIIEVLKANAQPQPISIDPGPSLEAPPLVAPAGMPSLQGMPPGALVPT